MVVKRCPDCGQTLPVACKSCHCGHVFISKIKSVPVQPSQAQEEDSCDSLTNMNIIREKRQRAKRENPDFEYCYPLNTTSSGGIGENTIPAFKKQRNNSSSQDAGPTDESHKIIIKSDIMAEQEISDERDFFGVGESSEPKKKRGRPKGSKNKPKTLDTPTKLIVPVSSSDKTTPKETDAYEIHGIMSSLDTDMKRKRGRPKGSKNKPKSILATPVSIKRKPESSSVSSTNQNANQSQAVRLIDDVMPVVSSEKAAAYSLVLSDINLKIQSQGTLCGAI